MVERGLAASCGGAEVMTAVLPSGRTTGRGLLLLGALICTEDVLTTGGRGRLFIAGLCSDAC